MPRKVKVVNIDEQSTYGDVAEAIVENARAENETVKEEQGDPIIPLELSKPKARAKRVAKPKAVAEDVAVEPEPAPEQVVAPKPRAKRVPKIKVVELPVIVEDPAVKPKAVRKPRVKKEELVVKPNNQVPPFPPRLSRTAAREALYHSLASSGLS